VNDEQVGGGGGALTETVAAAVADGALPRSTMIFGESVPAAVYSAETVWDDALIVSHFAPTAFVVQVPALGVGSAPQEAIAPATSLPA